MGSPPLPPVYDTTLVSNDAIADPDFNKTAAVEGSGIDYVHFHVATGRFSGQLESTYKSILSIGAS